MQKNVYNFQSNVLFSKMCFHKPNEIVYTDKRSTVKKVEVCIFKEEILLQGFYGYLSEF